MEHEEKPDDQHTTNKDQQDHAVNDESKNEDKSWIKWNKPLKKTLTNKEMCSQAISFLGAGYETTSTTLEFIAYNLAMNQNVQERLISEVDRILEKHVKPNKQMESSDCYIKFY
jgi:cytochrome P450